MEQKLPPRPKTLKEFRDTPHYVPSEDLPAFVICTRCACPVLAGEEDRHTSEMHGFRGGF